jgi:hypothetical protein
MLQLLPSPCIRFMADALHLWNQHKSCKLQRAAGAAVVPFPVSLEGYCVAYS